MLNRYPDIGIDSCIEETIRNELMYIQIMYFDIVTYCYKVIYF